MNTFVKKLAGLAIFAIMMASASHADMVRIALAEPPSDELAAAFVALDRAKANGLDYEWNAFV